MMKTIGYLAAAVCLLTVGSTGVAVAGPIGQTGSFSWTRQAGYYQGSGGEFSLEMTAGSLTNASYHDAGVAGDNNPAADLLSSRNIGIGNSTNFQTFCLEVSENATTPSYFVVGTAAYRGTAAVNDPISVGTAWLYSQFAQGALTVSGGNYFSAAGPSRDNEARLLQIAFWALEEEQLTNSQASSLATNPYYQHALSQFGSLADARVDAGEGEYGVYVLINFTKEAARDKFAADATKYDGKYRSQDFLYYQVSVPDGGATLMLLGGALVGIAALRRRLNG